MPLIYIPFPYSDELVLDERELSQNCFVDSKTRTIYFRGKLSTDFWSEKILYVCPYFPESPSELKFYNGWLYFQVDWKDCEFRKIVYEFIKPKNELRLITPPKDTINIAIHFRQGGSYDTEDVFVHPIYLTKFPSFDFYIEGLLKMVELFKGKLLYCYLFTDAENPSEFLEKLKMAIPEGTEITFDCRTIGNSHRENVLEDFFSLFNFHALIHPQSNFSIIPSLICDYMAIYAPISAHLENGKSVVDEVKFEIRSHQ